MAASQERQQLKDGQALTVMVQLERGSDDGGAPKAVKPPDAPPSISYFKLYSTATGLDWLLLVVGFIGGVANGCMLPLFSIVFGSFIDSFGTYTPECQPSFMPRMHDDAWFLGVINGVAVKFVWLALGAAAAGYLQQSAWSYAGTRIANKLRVRYLAAVLRQDVAFFDTQATTGGLLQGLNEDSAAVEAAIGDKVGTFLQHLSTFLVGYIIAFVKGWDITLVMVGCLPFLAGVGALLARMTTNLNNMATTAYSEAGAVVQQAISQVRTVAAYNGEAKAQADYDDKLDLPQRVGVRQGVVVGGAVGAMQFVMFVSYGVALLYGAFRVAAGAYSGGTVVSVIISALLGSFSLGMAAPNLQHFAKGVAAGARIWAVVNRVPNIDEDVQGGQAPDPDSVRGEVELRSVVFSYPARPDVPIFDGFNLTVPAGKTVALVGSSGSGKSTVVGLIERFYDPVAGQVLLDGIDIRALRLSWLRQQVGLVSQEPTLFATSIYENIAMGREGATPAEVQQAAVSANAAKFIDALPMGMDTQVGERGVQLSGGQKQRIAIARAILKNPKILLLDEATSALDSESERVVQDALDRMIVGRTTVVVAHRLSTIKGADVIAVVVKGAVVEQGRHDELLRNPHGAYTNLVKLQMQKNDTEEEFEEVVESGAAITAASAQRVVERRRSSGERGHRSSSGGAAAADPDDVSEAVRRASVDVARRVSGDAAAVAAKAGLGSAAVPPVAPSSLELQAVVVSDAAASKPPPRRAGLAGLLRRRRTAPASPSASADAPDAAPPAVPFRRLFAYNRPEWPWAVVGSAASAVVGAIQPAFAFVLTSMITIYFLPDTSRLTFQAGMYALGFLGIAVLVLVATLLQQLAFGVMGQRLARRIRNALFGAIMRQDISWFDRDENSSGKLASHLSTDAAYVRGAVGDVVGLLAQNLATMVVGYVLAFIFDWRMALLITAVGPLVAIGSFLHIRFSMGMSNSSDDLYATANQALSEAVGSIRVIHAYNLQARVTGLYNRLLRSADATALRSSQIGGAAMGYSMFVMFALYSIISWFGGLEVTSCRATFDQFFKAFMCVLMAAMGLAQAQIGFPDMAKAKGAVQRVFAVLDRVPPIDSSDSSGLAPTGGAVGAIELRNVEFRYPSRPTVAIFRDFNLTIPAGKMVALVGESGSGKSTVVGLIERFYDPIAGQVLLDGIDIKSFNIKWLRSQVGLVSQEPMLFSCSILDNIRYGSPDASAEQVEAAARAANAHDFVSELPEGYHTQVGERGVQLSGGQKQRIAIARAVVKDPKILLLDEATSALDAASERVVQDALDRIMVGRTSVVIAHRLSTIKAADTIAVVYHGVILEQGTHDELMSIPGGGYARLVTAQMQKAH